MKDQLLKVSRPKQCKCEPANVCEPATVWEPATKKQCDIASMSDQIFKASRPNHVSCQPATCTERLADCRTNTFEAVS